MRRRAALSALALALTGAAPPADTGRFVVRHAVIDPALGSGQAQYVADDPRLVGRLVTIAPTRVAFDGGACGPVRRTVARGGVAGVFGGGMPPARVFAHLQRHGLAIAGPIPIVRYRCPVTGTDKAARNWADAVSLPLGGGRRGLFWAGEALLELVPLRAANRPQPGFRCGRGGDAAERTICADPILSGWDASVTAAYRLLRDGGGPAAMAPADDRAALIQGQRAWLATRDRCGADAACLKARMQERADALMRRQYGVGT